MIDADAGVDRTWNRDVETAHLIEALRRTEAYSDDVDQVRFLQTHISLLFFTKNRVYKVKKPVDLGFLDFTTLDRRQHFCQEEVRLNRRLASDVYLGVVPIVRSAGGRIVVDGEGELVDWAVEMVRLPENRMLANLLERGAIDNEAMNSIAAMLVGFHRDAPTGTGIAEHGSPASITRNVEENFEQIRAFVDYPDRAASAGLSVLSATQFAFLRAQTRGYLATERELLERRVEEGRIREGHGDLHAGNICMRDDGPVAYDCIEFNRRFRCGDVASDLAFLAMDLDYRGYPAFSDYLVKRYAEAADDPGVRGLARFYKGYRAFIRGKVAAMTAADRTVDDAQRHEARRAAQRYLQLAASYELPPALILMCGLPASGKSWLAKRLARPLRAAVLHSDVRRKVLAGVAPHARAGEEYETGLYSPERKTETYRSLLGDAIQKVRSGQSVIVDATFSRRRYRTPFIDAVARLGLPYYVVRVAAPDAVVRERLARRANETRAVSDADLAVYLSERSSFEAPTEVPGGHLLEVASGEELPEDQSSLVLDRMIGLRRGD